MGSRCSSLARARRPIIHPSPRRARASTVHRIAAALQRNAAPYLQASTPLPISLHSATCSPRNPDKTTKTPQPFFLFTPSQEEKSRVDGDTCQPNRTDPSSMVPRFGIYCSLARGRRITLFSVRFTKVLLSSTDRREKKPRKTALASEPDPLDFTRRVTCCVHAFLGSLLTNKGKRIMASK